MAQYSREKTQKVMAQNQNLLQENAFVRRKNEELIRNLAEMQLKCEKLTKELEHTSKNLELEHQAHQKTQQELYNFQLREKKYQEIPALAERSPVEITQPIKSVREAERMLKEVPQEGKNKSNYWLVEGWW